MNKTTEFSFVLKPSKIGGVGVFAIHDIDANVLLTLVADDYKSRALHQNDIPDDLIMYCVAKEDDMWSCPSSFNRMEIAWHLNHSDDPNAKRTGKGEFYSAKKINKGDEITIDYNSLGEPEDKKEDFYKKTL
ncbi:SET domain-containing protein [Candidatus Nomurabacteria bacterium]|nr:SET domain-containing protein [Candidatus Nomurabacteria bacterium]